MATITSDFDDRMDSHSDKLAGEATTTLGAIVRPLGSLKLTVALFAFSLVIVLVGTLAQDELNMLAVKQRYFLSWIAMLKIDDFVPQSFYPHETPFWGTIPFPGGALIGVLLMINLVAAKTTRFKIHSSGGKLSVGLGFLAVGSLVAGVIVTAGNSTDGLQGEPGIGYDSLWVLTLIGCAALGFSTCYGASRAENPTVRTIAYGASASILAFVFYAVFSGFQISDPGLRIIWQLAKGLGAGLILAVGCLLVFGKQGGNVLLHMGVGLLMFGQFFFGDQQLEQRLSLVEGESTNLLINLDKVEMTFMETAEDEQRVIAIPAGRLVAVNQNVTASQEAELSSEEVPVIRDPAIPFDVRVLAFYPNSSLADVTSDNLATQGNGLDIMAINRATSGGADSGINVASAYVELFEKDTDKSLGVHLISQHLSERVMLIPDRKVTDFYDKVTVNDQDYELGLRFHREVKPYWVQLEDVRRTDFSGTETPRDYSSFVRIIHPEEGDDLRERVWMNNPLRYRGETFYQSSYTPLPNGKEQTGIQVVRNSGWLIPYVACSITGLGMLVHFLGTLTRFMKRRERESKKQQAELAEFELKGGSRLPVIATVVGFIGLAGIMLVPWTAVRNAMNPASRSESFDFYTAGKIPVQFGGRVMPLAAYARQSLKAMSNKESVPLEEAPVELKSRSQSKRSLSAMQWLMETAIDREELRELRMFRIDADEVRNELGLGRRESKLYSFEEIFKHSARIDRIVEGTRKKDPKTFSFKERKMIELSRRTRQYYVTSNAFQLPVPTNISLEEIQSIVPEADEQMRQMFIIRDLERRMKAFANMQAPAVVAPSQESINGNVNQPVWEKFSPAFFNHYSALVRSGESESESEAPLGVDTFSEMIKAYASDDTIAFNQAVDDHLAGLEERAIPGYQPNLVALERWMQSNWPTGVAMSLYLITLVMGLIYFFFHAPRLRMAVWGALSVAVIIHTVAILCRISITGRAPVINLYSSAVFIGWAAVLFGLIIERIFSYGIGNILSSVSGVLTLLVAYGLNQGDTMPVLQAVLDTQFWLATHVISVTLGYVATMVAGVFGIGYLVASWVNKDSKFLRDIYRSCYGAACFGILFSFVGTVLGGLWADDSWGRFWGWDPKENGALLIVIWNALILHARWDGMVKGHGFARLSIGGNVVTAWSWFGTNELGIGLHSYGFTTGVLMWLSLFVGSQILVLAIDFLISFARVGMQPNSAPPANHSS